MPFSAYELKLTDKAKREEVVETLSKRQENPVLVLDTCQRLECYGIDVGEDPRWKIAGRYDANEAFERIARIAAGLESRVVGELEVLGQVRSAYKAFRETTSGNAKKLDRIFQDALSLGREARRTSEVDRNLISLSAITARTLMDRVPSTASVAVVGAGSLATSVARYIRKRGGHPLRVASRCPENAFVLATEVNGYSTGLDEIHDLFDGVSGIITATAAPHPLIYSKHLENAASPLTIIDLGEPADCDQSVIDQPNVSYVSLLEIEEKAHINTKDRLKRAEVAARIIRDGALAWTARS